MAPSHISLRIRVTLTMWTQLQSYKSYVPLRISLDLLPLCKGYPLGFHWISIDLPPLCDGYPLGFHWISMDLHIIPDRILWIAIPQSVYFISEWIDLQREIISKFSQLWLRLASKLPGRIHNRWICQCVFVLNYTSWESTPIHIVYNLINSHWQIQQIWIRSGSLNTSRRNAWEAFHVW